jgi:hypothetical protein
MKKEKIHTIKSSGFKIPKDYFENFDANLFNKINTKQSIKNIESPGFKVPKDYFETVEDSIFRKIKSEDETPLINLKPKRSFYFIAGVAASLLLVFTVFKYRNTSDGLSAEVVETYFENQYFNSYELAQLLSDTDFLGDNFTIIETVYNKDTLETYLLENADIEFILD